MAGFFRALVEKFRGRPVDWDELEESLLRADLGVPMTLRIMESLKARAGNRDADAVLAVAREEIAAIMPPPPALPGPYPDRPVTVLVVGVNGTGKTTSSAKLAAHLQRQNRRVLLVAADTFRAAAIEQLQHWGDQLGLEVVSGKYGADPAALCYDAWSQARRKKADYLLCDTAGRLHTKDNLMKELSKVVRIVAKQDADAPQEKFLVVDATTGTNALVQAKEFHSAIGLTGIILTKLDGSGKGGVAAAIATELGLPTRFIGTGEAISDFAAFDAAKFAAEMI
ncbi:MAG: signal recognition particle-docking protein FtsY [Terrimicrobiaceae bacterium]